MTKTDWTAEEVRKVIARCTRDWGGIDEKIDDCENECLKIMTAFAERIKADEGEGEICFTTDAKGNILAVTRNDSYGRILSVLAESPAQLTKLEDAVREVVALLRATSNTPASDRRYAADKLTAALQENAK